MVQLPLGDDRVEVTFPDCDVTVAEPPGGDTVDVREAAERAVADPHGPALAELADPDDLVTVVVTDETRATPDDVLLDVLLADLELRGRFERLVHGSDRRTVVQVDHGDGNLV